MDLKETLEQLYAQKQKLEHALDLLNKLQAGGPSAYQLPGRRRGRRSMPAAERHCRIEAVGRVGAAVPLSAITVYE